jgi:hypothetical protein
MQPGEQEGNSAGALCSQTCQQQIWRELEEGTSVEIKPKTAQSLQEPPKKPSQRNQRKTNQQKAWKWVSQHKKSPGTKSLCGGTKTCNGELQ